MAVDVGVPMPGKMLRGRGDPGGVETSDRGLRHHGHQRGLRAERPGADHRVGRGDVHIGDRRVIQVDADRAQLPPGGAFGRLHQGWVPGRPRRELAGERRENAVKPGDDAALLICADGERHRRRLRHGGTLQPIGQARNLRRVTQIGAEIDDSAEVIPAHQVSASLGRCDAWHGRHEELADLLRQAHPRRERLDVGAGVVARANHRNRMPRGTA